MSVKPFIEGSAKDGFRVGTNDLSDVEFPYYGPVAEVYIRGVFITIETDDHEGSAMLRVEALPLLIQALEALEKSRNA